MLGAMSESLFLPGTQLSSEFYAEVVRPVLDVVEQTARHGTDLGFTVHTVSDCVAAVNDADG